MQELRVLREYAGEGAAKVVRALRTTCGTRRTRQAVQMQASRMGVSLVKRHTCPGCGRVCRNDFWVPRKQMCKLCAARSCGEPPLSRAEVDAAAEVTAEDERLLAEARRRNAMMRQRRYKQRMEDPSR